MIGDPLAVRNDVLTGDIKWSDVDPLDKRRVILASMFESLNANMNVFKGAVTNGDFVLAIVAADAMVAALETTKSSKSLLLETLVAIDQAAMVKAAMQLVDDYDGVRARYIEALKMHDLPIDEAAAYRERTS